MFWKPAVPFNDTSGTEIAQFSFKTVCETPNETEIIKKRAIFEHLNLINCPHYCDVKALIFSVSFKCEYIHLIRLCL